MIDWTYLLQRLKRRWLLKVKLHQRLLRRPRWHPDPYLLGWPRSLHFRDKGTQYWKSWRQSGSHYRRFIRRYIKGNNVRWRHWHWNPHPCHAHRQKGGPDPEGLPPQTTSWSFIQSVSLSWIRIQKLREQGQVGAMVHVYQWQGARFHSQFQRKLLTFGAWGWVHSPHCLLGVHELWRWVQA